LRSFILTASAFALALPAAASAQADTRQQPEAARPAPERDEAIVREMPSQREMEATANAVGRVAEALMDVKVGPIVEAIEPGRRLSRRERERTLGDVASRDDPYARERVRDSVSAVAAGMGGMVDQLAMLTPVLRRTIEDAAERVEEAMRTRDRRRDGRDD
jgi:hypothetical protein